MPEMNVYVPGTFCWVDLATTDASAASRFYHELFGWTLHDMPIDETCAYTVAQVRGRDVGALYQQVARPDAHSHWNCYVAVDDAEVTAEKAGELGGEIISSPFEVMDAGRMAVLRGPSGAWFAAWEPRRHPGAGLVREPSCLYWNELVTRQTNAAKNFYSYLFGWRSERTRLDGRSYTVFKRSHGNSPVAGMRRAHGTKGDSPSRWVAYFGVDDCDGCAEHIVRLGGRILSPPSDLAGIGRCAVAIDPQEADFGIIQPN